MATIVKTCTKCKEWDKNEPGAEFQNERYGMGKRVMNKTASKENNKFRCTVCNEVN